MDVTGRRTVPQVFIGSKFVGGCDGESSMSMLRCAWSVCITLRCHTWGCVFRSIVRFYTDQGQRSQAGFLDVINPPTACTKHMSQPN